MFIKVSKMLLSIAVISSSFHAAPAHAIWPFTKKVTVNVSADLKGTSFPPCSEDMIGEVCMSSSGLIRLDEVQKDAACKERRMKGTCDKYLGPVAKVKYVSTYSPKQGTGGTTDPKQTGGTSQPGCVKTIKVEGKIYVVCGEADIVDDGGTNTEPKEKVVVVDRPSTTVYTTSTTRVRYRDPRAQAQYEFDQLYGFCKGEVVELIEESGDNLNDKRRERDEAATELDALKKAADDAYKAALINCRKDCLQIAINPADFSLPDACKIDRRALAELVDLKDFEVQPNSDRVNLDSKKAIATYFENGQAAENQELANYIRGRSMDGKLDGVCSKLVNSKSNPNCAGAIEKLNPPALGKCESWGPYVDAKIAYDTAVKKHKQLVAAVDKLERKSGSCVASADNLASLRISGPDCLQKASDSCDQAIEKAMGDLQVKLRTPYCATCGYDGGGQGVCGYGSGCGVNKTAQMISAIGGVAVPLGLGIMNLAMHNKSVNACLAMNAQAMDVSRAVGLPPPAAACGGMGGFGGGFMGGGMGMMGMPGMGIGGGIYGGMGMPGMMGMGGMMGMPGMGLGINAGLNIGMGNPWAMGGMNMGGGIYNPMMMGQMGGMNPMMGMQGNAYGVQQQMMDAQMRMQHMAQQNMVLQQSAMMGGMYGQMGGAYGMQMSPFYNMGYQGGVNPMMNMGVMNSFQMNPWAYAGGAGGYYNPMMYGGANAGISGGINAGINLGFNTGFNGGAYGYNGYPSMATPPYAGYNNYGYNAGYGPYGNTGYYPSYSAGCGVQVGIPCGF